MIYGVKIASPEQINMHQQWIQVVNIGTAFEVGLQRVCGMIGLVKPFVKSAKQAGKGQFGFAMSVINGWINEARGAIFIG